MPDSKAKIKNGLLKTEVKAKLFDVEPDSPVVRSPVKNGRMKLISAQAVETARLKRLRYTWINCELIKTGPLLKNMGFRNSLEKN